MRIYPDPEKWQEKLSKVPLPLRNKALLELDAVYLERGFKPRGNFSKDANGTYCDIDIRPGTTLQQVHDFLGDFSVAAVTVEPEDIEKIWGKNPVSLGVRRYLEIVGSQEGGVQLLEPDNLADALVTARQRSWGNPNGDESGHGLITDDLVMNGMLDFKEENATDKWLEAQPEHIGLRIGADAHFNEDSDMGEFTPDFEAENWGQDY